MPGALGGGPTIVVIGILGVVGVPLIMARPAVAQIITAAAAVVDVPRQGTPVRDPERLAEIHGQKAGDTIEHHLRRHGLQICFQGRQIPVEVAADDVLAAIVHLQLTEGGRLMLARPDRGLGEHEKAVRIVVKVEPGRQGHPIVRELRKVGRGRFARWL